MSTLRGAFLGGLKISPVISRIRRTTIRMEIESQNVLCIIAATGSPTSGNSCHKIGWGTNPRSSNFTDIQVVDDDETYSFDNSFK